MTYTKELLLARLNALYTTMVGVHNRNQTLEMGTWIDSSPCGTVACICGWQSLGDLTHFPGENAEEISYDLIAAAEDVFDFSYLAWSIYLVEAKFRRQYASLTKLFSEEELDQPHLTGEPTAIEAANYIALCIDKVKAYEE